MFNAPELILKIPDIAQIYAKNENQEQEIDEAIEKLDSDIFIDTMSVDKVERWEQIFNITPSDTDTLNERRFRVKNRTLEAVPYTYRVLKRKLSTLSQDGYNLIVGNGYVKVKLALKSKKMMEDILNMIEDIVPLNMTVEVSIIWNQYSTLSQFTYGQLSSKTHKEVREEVFS